VYGLLDWDGLDSLKPPEWLVEDTIPTDAFVLLWGLWGAGKTFLALDLALSIATGQRWHGKVVKHGPVVYVAGEGVRGLNQRRRDWATRYHKGEAVADFYVLPASLPMLDPTQVTAFGDQIETTVGRPPVMIVIDTLARCTAGGNENDQLDMGTFVSNCDQLRTRFPEAVVLVLHHPSKAGVAPRGSTVLTGAAETILKMETDDAGLRKLHCDKQKDAAEFEDKFFFLETVDLSCVLVPTDAPVSTPVTKFSSLSTKLGKQCFDALRARGPATHSDWRGAANTSPASFDRYRKLLVHEGLVVMEGEIYRVATPVDRANARDEVENANY
jgi:hypothetical protein